MTTSRKKNVVNRKCTPKGSFLKEVFDHIDLKLSQNPTSSFKIPEIARHFLDIGKCDKVYLHCLSIDFKNKNPSSTSITEFLSFCSATMKEELCREAEDATKNQYQNPLWNRLRYSFDLTLLNFTYVMLNKFLLTGSLASQHQY